jgi:hypothetical protein
MELNLGTDVNRLLSRQDIIEKGTKLNIKVGHVRYLYEQTKEDKGISWCYAVKAKIPTLLSVEPIEPLQKQLEFLVANWQNAGLFGCITDIVSNSLNVDPVNVCAMVTMLNQKGIVEANFLGGDSPKIQIISDSKCVNLNLITGMGHLSQNCVNLLASVGMKRVSPIPRELLNFAFKASIIGKVNPKTKRWEVSSIGKENFHGPFDKGCVFTGVTEWCQNSISGASHGVEKSIVQIASTVALQPVIKAFDKRKVGLPFDKFKSEIVSFRSIRLVNAKLNELLSFDDCLKNGLGKRFKYFKNVDCAGFNAPLKWSCVMNICFGFPVLRKESGEFCKNVSYDELVSLSIYYFGAAGGRAREVFEIRGVVKAYDIIPPMKYTARMTEGKLLRYGLKNWELGDITTFSKYEECEDKTQILISDVYMESWKSDRIDPYGVDYCVNLLTDAKSQVPKFPLIKLFKTFVCPSEMLIKFKDCYPFYVFDVCRIVTTEIIIGQNVDDNLIPLEKRIANACYLYGWPELKDRVYLIRNHIDLEKCYRSIMRLRVVELDFQIRTLGLDFNEFPIQPRNRKLWLSNFELPRLLVPRYLSASSLGSAKFSALFNSVMGGRTDWEDDGFFSDHDDNGNDDDDDEDQGILEMSDVKTDNVSIQFDT